MNCRKLIPKIVYLETLYIIFVEINMKLQYWNLDTRKEWEQSI